MDRIEYTKKEYITLLTVTLDEFVECAIKHDLDKTNLKISQSHLITNITWGFNYYMKSIMTFNTPTTKPKDIVRKKETGTIFY